MTEADQVFARLEERGSKSRAGETRIIHSAPRRSMSGSVTSRAVEVVHTKLGGPGSDDNRTRRSVFNVRAASWPDGFRPKSPLPTPRVDLLGPASEPAQQVTHVTAAWEPAHRRQPAPQVPEAAKPFVQPSIAERRAQPAPTPRPPRASIQEAATRAFADPFSHDDNRANCIRCGFLVEPARESRDMLTCATCG